MAQSEWRGLGRRRRPESVHRTRERHLRDRPRSLPISYWTTNIEVESLVSWAWSMTCVVEEESNSRRSLRVYRPRSDIRSRRGDLILATPHLRQKEARSLRRCQSIHGQGACDERREEWQQTRSEWTLRRPVQSMESPRSPGELLVRVRLLPGCRDR